MKYKLFKPKSIFFNFKFNINDIIVDKTNSCSFLIILGRCFGKTVKDLHIEYDSSLTVDKTDDYIRISNLLQIDNYVLKHFGKEFYIYSFLDKSYYNYYYKDKIEENWQLKR